LCCTEFYQFLLGFTEFLLSCTEFSWAELSLGLYWAFLFVVYVRFLSFFIAFHWRQVVSFSFVISVSCFPCSFGWARGKFGNNGRQRCGRFVHVTGRQLRPFQPFQYLSNGGVPTKENPVKRNSVKPPAKKKTTTRTNLDPLNHLILHLFLFSFFLPPFCLCPVDPTIRRENSRGFFCQWKPPTKLGKNREKNVSF